MEYQNKEKTKPRLWVLEDETDLRTIMAYLAEQRGFEPCAFSSIKEAWEALAEAEQNPAQLAPHYIISDFNLMDGDSEKWLDRMRIVFPSARIVCLSRSLTQEIADRLKNRGILSIEKPASLGRVLELLQSEDQAELNSEC